ncbi:MAG: DUF2971 domain-containing protein [Selenomonadaceae bacterium]
MKKILREKIPDTLYKYMPWNNYTKELFEKQRFYMCQPENLNDPFDADIKVNMVSCTDEEILEGLIKSFEKNVERSATAEELQALCKKVKGWEGEEFRKYNQNKVEEILSKIRKEIGITCFSNNSLYDKENMLMWSHYTDSHKGVCLVFKSSYNWSKYLKKAIYSNKYPFINWIKMVNDDGVTAEEKRNKIIELYYYKHDIWEYENEYRIIQNINELGQFLPFNPKSLKEIICGCNMKDEQVNEVKETLKIYPYRVKLWQAEKEEFRFKLKTEFIGMYGKHE